MQTGSAMYRLAARMPDGVLRRLQHLAGSSPRARPVIQWLTSPGRSGEHPIASGPAKGLRISVDGSRPSYVLGVAEVEMQRFFAQHIRPGDTVLDIGANVGFFTLIAAVLTGPAGRVVSFEPQPENVSTLRRNVAANGLAQVEVVEAAVSDQVGESALHINTSDQVASLVHARTAGSVTVRTVTVDSETDRLQLAPSFLKIDVEGAEEAVITGTGETLTSARPIVVCEVHTNRPSFDHPVAVALRAAGYHLSWLEEGVAGAHDVWAPHLVAIPA